MRKKNNVFYTMYKYLDVEQKTKFCKIIIALSM